MPGIGGPKISTSTPESSAPRAIASGPKSAPFASSAITRRGLLGGRRIVRDDLAAGVGAAVGADTVRHARRAAVRARALGRRGDLVRRAPLIRAAVGLLLLGDRH